MDWSHAHGFLVRNQSHGAPANLLDLYGTVDIPETEVFGSTPFPIPGLRRNPADVRAGDDLPESLVIRMASSAAHVMGHPRASSETCTWLREHWKVTLSDTKPEIDRLFLNGINHIFYHGTVFSPEDAAWPGWFFYASTQFNPNNPWWGDFGALNTYVARVQSVLQSGQPDNDFLLYWPFADALDDPHGLMRQFTVHDVGWLRDSPTGRLATRLSAAGYSYDYISDAQLLQTEASGGELATPGHRYRVLIVPTTRRMPVETLQRLITLARGGATVIFEGLPEDVPGYGRLAERRAQFTALLAAPELRNAVVRATEPTASETTAPDDRHESGAHGVAVSAAATDLGVADRASKPSPLLSRLHALGVPRESVVETGLGFIRRASENGHDYFFANLTANDFDGWVTLGTAAGSAALLDPLTGRFGAAALRHTPDGRAQIYLQLASGQSMLLRTQTSVAPRAWTYVKPAAAPGAPFTLAGTWRVKFLRGGPALPPPFETRVLKSWTELDGPETQRFAGTARYRLEFDLPAAPVADDWLLDLGDVRESARVRLNGTEIATAWSLPFRLRVGAQLQPGRNVLELDVTNLAANRIRDLDRRHVPWKIMREIDIVNIHYQPFDASAWPLTPSGLLGPVTLAPLRAFHPQPATPNHHP